MSVPGYIVGQVSGRGFWDAMEDYVRNDLGLKHTFLGNTDMTGYDRKENPCRCWQWEKEDSIAPAGALNADIEDLLLFGKMQCDGRCVMRYRVPAMIQRIPVLHGVLTSQCPSHGIPGQPDLTMRGLA